MKLSERMFGLIDMCGGDAKMIRGWADEVAQLEAERDGYRNQYHMAEAKILSRDALLEQLSEEQLTQDLAKAEAENERLKILQRPDGWHERVEANYFLSDELRELLHRVIDETEDGEFVVFSIYEPDDALPKGKNDESP